MTTDKRIPISERALMARINRRLAKEEPWPQKMCKTRPGSMAENNLGTYYTINTYMNTIEAYHIEDLEKWTKEYMPEALSPAEFAYIGSDEEKADEKSRQEEFSREMQALFKRQGEERRALAEEHRKAAVKRMDMEKNENK